MDSLKNLRAFSGISRYAGEHLHQAAWLGLSLVMCMVLAVAGRNADLPLRTWLALFAAGILTAGACVWIVRGEDDDRTETDPPAGADPQR